MRIAAPPRHFRPADPNGTYELRFSLGGMRSVALKLIMARALLRDG